MDESFSSREARRGESAEEVAFWCRYWETLREEGVAAGREVWHERPVRWFIRIIRPRRLREATARDVADWRSLLVLKPECQA